MVVLDKCTEEYKLQTIMIFCAQDFSDWDIFEQTIRKLPSSLVVRETQLGCISNFVQCYNAQNDNIGLT